MFLYYNLYMPPEQKDKQDIIIEELKQLNESIVKQDSLRRRFFVGVVHGIGFFLGSAILATIALGIFGPWFAEIDWIRESFERGSSLQ